MPPPRRLSIFSFRSLRVRSSNAYYLRDFDPPRVEGRTNESTRRFTGPRMEDSALGFFSISHDSTSRTRNARDTRVETLERTWADRPITRSATNRFLHAVLADVQHAVSLPDGLETCWAILRFFFTPILKFPLENGNQFSMIISRNVSQRIGISTRIMVN